MPLMWALLDVNGLIALLDEGHSSHVPAMAWLEEEVHQGWASCPITQNGCINMMSHPGYPGALPAAEVAQRLAEALAGPDHEFWPDGMSLLDPALIDCSRLLGHRQVTDIYLLALAVRSGGRLVTLDRRVPLEAVNSASQEHLVLIH